MMSDVFVEELISSVPVLRSLLQPDVAPGRSREGSAGLGELSTAVSMRVRLLENMDALLSGDGEFAEPAGLTGGTRRTPSDSARTPQETATLAEEDSDGENDAATLAATVVPPQMPEVFPAMSSDDVRIRPAASIEYRIVEPPHSGPFFIPERNALDLRA